MKKLARIIGKAVGARYVSTQEERGGRVITALASAGYRILAPGEWDRETGEKIANLIERDELIDTTVRLDRQRHRNLSDWFAAQRASAIRSLPHDKEAEG